MEQIDISMWPAKDDTYLLLPIMEKLNGVLVNEGDISITRLIALRTAWELLPEGLKERKVLTVDRNAERYAAVDRIRNSVNNIPRWVLQRTITKANLVVRFYHQDTAVDVRGSPITRFCRQARRAGGNESGQKYVQL